MMGFIQFESVDHANRVADLLGAERPYSDRIGDDADETLTKVLTGLSMAHSVAQITGEVKTTSELLADAFGEEI